MIRIPSLIVVVLLLAAGARATTFPRDTTEALIEQAERVCCGSCERVEQRVDPRTGLVFTYVRLRLLEDLKGRGEGDTIELRFVGGRVGDLETVVLGMPRFREGEESVLLLGRRNRLGHPVLVQARRGVIGLRKDAEGRRHLRRALAGLPGVDATRPPTLDEFRAAVRRVVRESERRAQEREAR